MALAEPWRPMRFRARQRKGPVIPRPNPQPPNVVICLCDQMRAFAVGAYGHPTVRTPNIDGLAASGVAFETACSNSPLCVPARSVLMSGQYGRTCVGTNSNYCGFPPCERRVVCQDPLLSEVFRGAGYRTGWVGKWHLHPAPSLVGFDEAVIPHNLHLHHGQAFYDIAGRRRVVDGFSLDYEIERVRDFVNRDGKDPFFLVYSLSPPHMPLLDAPERYTRMYDREDVRLRPNTMVDGKLVDDPDWFRVYLFDHRGHLALNLKDEEVEMPDDYRQRRALAPMFGMKHVLAQVRALMDDPDAGPAVRRRFPFLDNAILDGFDLTDLTALYYGMVSCVDDYVGKLMETLEGAGVGENTLVVFLSDHGDLLGSHHLWMKDHVYEEAMRIPMVFRWPGGIETRGASRAVASLVDVAPTLLALAGIDAPETMQGRDLAPVLRGEAGTVGEDMAFIEAYRHRYIGVRTPTHLYALRMIGGDEAEWRPSESTDDHLFFDLRDDPYEQRNLAETTEQRDVAERLCRRLMEWHEETPRRSIPPPTRRAGSAAIY